MNIERALYLERLIKRRDNGMAKVITGIRRCGKSYLLFELYGAWLRAQGVPPDHIVGVQLDDIAYRALRDPLRLYEHIRDAASGEGAYYVFLDEIQYVEAFSDVINGLLHLRNVDVYVTGSNSRFLSSDILTEFRGRGDEVRVRPLTFAEAASASSKSLDETWKDYFTFGGMPAVLSLPDDETKAMYLSSLINKVYLTDIRERNNIAHDEALDSIMSVLASSAGSLTSPSKIAATFASMGTRGVTDKTVKRYVGLLEDAFLVERAQRYDVKGRSYIGTSSKYYFEDVGLRNSWLNFRQQEENHIMENVLYNELRARGWSVDVGVIDTRETTETGKRLRKQLEIDFVATKGNERCYLQSAFRIPDAAKERQEKRSLERLGDSFRKIVIVRDNIKPWRDDQGILTMGLFDFLLDPHSLER